MRCSTTFRGWYFVPSLLGLVLFAAQTSVTSVQAECGYKYDPDSICPYGYYNRRCFDGCFFRWSCGSGCTPRTYTNHGCHCCCDVFPTGIDDPNPYPAPGKLPLNEGSCIDSFNDGYTTIATSIAKISKVTVNGDEALIGTSNELSVIGGDTVHIDISIYIEKILPLDGFKMQFYFGVESSTELFDCQGDFGGIPADFTDTYAFSFNHVFEAGDGDDGCYPLTLLAINSNECQNRYGMPAYQQDGHEWRTVVGAIRVVNHTSISIVDDNGSENIGLILGLVFGLVVFILIMILCFNFFRAYTKVHEGNQSVWNEQTLSQQPVQHQQLPDEEPPSYQQVEQGRQGSAYGSQVPLPLSIARPIDASTAQSYTVAEVQAYPVLEESWEPNEEAEEPYEVY
jgi:hypothetical protein